MNKKELIISLIKLDRFYNKKIDELSSILDSEVEGLYPGYHNNIKSIEEIIYDIADIPEDTSKESIFYVGTPEDAEKGFDKGYCRDAIGEIYSKATLFSEMTIKKVAEIIISVGENKGYFLPKYEKYLGIAGFKKK